MTEPTAIRRRVLYRGTVQGVGFRATARRIARRHAVTGFVRNLADGGVELVAEGSPGVVQACLAELAEAMAGNIEDCAVESLPAAGQWQAFDIR
jgi:acylphosphatase